MFCSFDLQFCRVVDSGFQPRQPDKKSTSAVCTHQWPHASTNTHEDVSDMKDVSVWTNLYVSLSMCVCVKAFWHFEMRLTAARSSGKMRWNSTASILTYQLDYLNYSDSVAHVQIKDNGWVRFRSKEGKHADGTCLRNKRKCVALSEFIRSKQKKKIKYS